MGCQFKVRKDNNPLTYFLTSSNMDAMKQRWINELAKYDFSLEYQKGKNNTVADIVSILPHITKLTIEVSVKSARLSTQMHVMDWAEAQHEDQEIKATMDWCCHDK